MKKIILFFFFVSITYFNGQNLKDFITPSGYKKIQEVKGDLDKDGVDEIVVLFDTNTKSKNNDGESKIRELFILKKIDNQLKIWSRAKGFLISSQEGFYPNDNLVNVEIKNNCLVIFQQYFTNSRHTEGLKYTFRFQNKAFYLIGASNRFEDTCDFNLFQEINFSTGKIIIDEKYSSCDEDAKNTPKDYYKEFIHKFTKLIRLEEFEMGKQKIDVPNSKKYFYY